MNLWHYGSNGQAECGADYPNMQLTTVPGNVTCRTCRGWLPIVAPRAANPAPLTDEQANELGEAIRSRLPDDSLYFMILFGNGEVGAEGRILGNIDLKAAARELRRLADHLEGQR